MRNFCSDWVSLGSLGMRVFSALALVAFRFVSLCVLAVSCLWVLVSVVVGCAVVLFVVKNVLISLVSVDVLLFCLCNGPVVAVGVAF